MTSRPKEPDSHIIRMGIIIDCIAERLTFQPPEPTYTFIPVPGQTFTSRILLQEEAGWQYTQRELDFIEGFHT